MRQPHKVAHPGCPHANWGKCDLAKKVQHGQCNADVGEKAPRQCSRWAVSAEGWCEQHHVAQKEAAIRQKRERDARAALLERIDYYIAMFASHPSVWDRVPPPGSNRPYRIDLLDD